MFYKPESDNHISVCICTFKRPQMLSNLLSKLQDQVTEDRFTYSAVVVDNDANKTALDTVTDWKNKSSIQIDYFCEPEQNIALARNKAVANAKGNFIAFIDDDEFPDKNWLINLFKTLNQYQCAGVLGPVKPYFETAPPEWIIKGKICERESFPTGTILKNEEDTRTGNVLFDGNIFINQSCPFHRVFGKTGGEDTDFFSRMISKDLLFIWCDEACVYEIVPPDRFTKKYHLKRALLRGVVSSGKTSLISLNAFKSLLAFIFYTISLPFLILPAHHLFMKYLIKDCDHIGKLFGLFKIKVIKIENYPS